jgi:hypothetical protein
MFTPITWTMAQMQLEPLTCGVRRDPPADGRFGVPLSLLFHRADIAPEYSEMRATGVRLVVPPAETLVNLGVRIDSPRP